MHSLGSQGISLFILVAHIVGHFLAGSLHLLPCVFELMKGGGLGLDIGFHVGIDISPFYRSSPDFFRMEGSPEHRHGAGGFQVYVETVNIHCRIGKMRIPVDTNVGFRAVGSGNDFIFAFMEKGVLDFHADFPGSITQGLESSFGIFQGVGTAAVAVNKQVFSNVIINMYIPSFKNICTFDSL